MAKSGKSVVLPSKVPTKALAQTVASGYDKGQTIEKDNFQVLNNTIQSLRGQNQTAEAVRRMTAFEGTTSTAVYSFVEVAHTGFQVTAHNTSDHEFNPEATSAAKSILAQMNTLYDYTKGYADKRPISNVIETGLSEIIATGAIALELVLDKTRLPHKINVIPYDSLQWVASADGGKYPRQTSKDGGYIELNYATIFVAESHNFANSAYSRSMLEPALNDAFHYREFIEDMRRAVRRSGHNRIVVTLEWDRIIQSCPSDIAKDDNKKMQWMEDVRKEVESTLQDLAPEDAIVTFDSAVIDVKSTDGDKADYATLMGAISGNLATALKSNPSILGLRIEGSQSLSNTESLIFLKVARAIQRPIEQTMSRLLTLACRLYGIDVYVSFSFDPINLRPEDELEAFSMMKQQRVMELLSYGFISDDQAANQLGTGQRPAGAPPLSGTLFLNNNGGIDATKASPNSDPQGRALQPDTPTKAGGSSQ